MSTVKDRLPRVAIIGRPNVGKSTLFNMLTRSRSAVVKNEPGVTRDIQMGEAHWWGKTFEVVDTGGVTDASDVFSKLIKEQVNAILSSVDFLFVVMDGRLGLVPEDRDIIRLAKQSGKPCLIVVNKVDQGHQAELVKSEFYEFGLDVHAASFERQEGVDHMVEWALAQIPEDIQIEESDRIRLAIIGKPNVGKSSFCNFLLSEKRMVVSDIAGTTVDAIESPFVYNEREYTLVDTAGLRRSSKREDGVEVLSSFKSYQAIDRSNIVLLMVDGLMGPTVQDAKMIQYILEQHKAVILVVNKSDLGKQQVEAYRSTVRTQVKNTFHFFNNIPVAFISAKTGSGVDSLFELIEDTWDKLNIRIKTSQLNDFFFKSIRGAPSPVYGTQNVKFYYLVQTRQTPPSFIAFANHPEGVTPSYKRFLAKRIQKEFDLDGIPIRIYCMKSRKKKKGGLSQKAQAERVFHADDLDTMEWTEDLISSAVVEFDEAPQ